MSSSSSSSSESSSSSSSESSSSSSESSSSSSESSSSSSSSSQSSSSSSESSSSSVSSSSSSTTSSSSSSSFSSSSSSSVSPAPIPVTDNFRPVWKSGLIGVEAPASGGSINIITVKGKPSGHIETQYQIYDKNSGNLIVNLKSSQTIRPGGTVTRLTKDQLTIQFAAGNQLNIRVRARTGQGWGQWSSLVGFTSPRKGRLFRRR